MALSSDESVTIFVGHKSDIRNPWGNLNVNEVPIEIVEDLYQDDNEELDNLMIVSSHPGV